MEDEKFKQEMDQAMAEIQIPQTRKDKKTKPIWKYALIVLALALVGAAAWRLFIYESKPSATDSSEAALQTEQQTEEENEAATEPEFDSAVIKKVLNDWSATAGGTYGVTITDKDGKVLAEKNSTKQFFTASIYKLYTAYIGYQKIDDGTHNLSEPYLGSWTRKKCLDEMIRTSHSPCAEKLWNELGKENLTAKLKTYGIKNTNMIGLTTTSGDAAIMLAMLERGEGISPASREAMMNSMLEQIYQDTLQTGFKKAKVYSKIGFNGNLEYHDTAIVHLEDGRSLVVSVLTSGVGTKKIAQLGANLEAALTD